MSKLKEIYLFLELNYGPFEGENREDYYLNLTKLSGGNKQKRG